MKKRIFPLLVIFLALVLVVTACGPGAGTTAPTEEAVIPSATDTLTFITMPGEPGDAVSVTEDEVFPSDFGDDFNVNQYERPFVDNLYRQDIDIVQTSLSDNGDWYTFTTQMVGQNTATGTLDIHYGIEIDIDKDGRGDFLVWAIPPYTANWTKSNVQVLTDENNDVGGLNPVYSEPNDPLFNGYETAVFNRGVGTDIDAAWVRISPLDANALQIALKKSILPTNQFLWNPWADFALANPAQFDYNDFYTAQEAGSPYASSPYAPLGTLYGLDNICRTPYGFTPTRQEPGMCSWTPTTQAHPTPTRTQAPPAACSDPIWVVAHVSDGTRWDPAWKPNVELCIDTCWHPDPDGLVTWNLPAGTYTINASATSFKITPSSAVVSGCGETIHSYFEIGPP